MTEKELQNALEWVEKELEYWEKTIKGNPQSIEEKGQPEGYLHLKVIQDIIKETIWRNQSSQKKLFPE